MPEIESLFVTRHYRARLDERGKPLDMDELEATAAKIRAAL